MVQRNLKLSVNPIEPYNYGIRIGDGLPLTNRAVQVSLTLISRPDFFEWAIEIRAAMA